MSEASREVISCYSFDVFLSYADRDVIFARKLVEWLRQSDYKVWIAEEQLVPGSQFRAGLQQGLRESRHMVVILTHAYVNRSWTQREVDLFDLDADHSERRMLAIQVGGFPAGVLDQTFLVHQRIPWGGWKFDPEAFWLLNCGLLGRRPGDRKEWNANGLELLGESLTRLAKRAPNTESPSRKEPFGELRDKITRNSAESVVRDFYKGFTDNGSC